MALGEVDVAIVGAGFGGLGAAIELRRAGFDDFLVLERSAEVGGTWAANTYPGCQCDVPSNLYSFSFAPRPDWSHAYPEQPQILDYLNDCADRFGVRDRIRLDCELLDAEWLEDRLRWRIETTDGELHARVLVAAPGLLSEPVFPQVDGVERFAGDVFHSARWDPSADLAGRRVAMVGTGASAIQIVPRIQPIVDRMYVVQRTPPWIIPHPDREISGVVKDAYRALPMLQRLARYGVYWAREGLAAGFVAFPPILKMVETNARIHRFRQVRDPELRCQVTPGYALGCKRILLSDDWYPALQEPNVELLSGSLGEVRERSIVLADGREREVDTIVFATGFRTTDPPLAHRLRGRGGVALSAAWMSGMRAYRGTTVTGFPNLFLLYGPNTNLAHSSIVFMLESQIRYVVDGLRAMRLHGATAVEPRPAVQDAWNSEMQERLRDTVWNTGGCASWYLDRGGDNPIMWPGFTFEFRRRTRRFAPSDYLAERDGVPHASGDGAHDGAATRSRRFARPARAGAGDDDRALRGA
jgi:cation diffusion facilitator CzcD-associated flavoprotein CzcO